MSKFTQYIKRTLRYIFHGVPVVINKVEPKVSVLSKNELLKGRTALITGGTKGIGKSIAEAFLNAGANIIITSRNQSSANTIAEELKCKYSSQLIVGVELDNRDVNSISSKLDEITSIIAPHQISILVNNAGVLGGNIGHTSVEEWDNVIDANLRGVFFMSEYVVEYMKKNSIQGNILMIASSSSLRPAISAYTISKWGLRSFTLGLAKVCAPLGITVNGIAPGPTATAMLNKEDVSDIYRPSSPISRYSLPEEIANMAVILSSDMGRSVVGDIVYMTGGAGLITFDDVEYNL